MKALSVKPPWSWAIAHAYKNVENRSWPTSHRGLVAIHASKTPERDVVFPVPRAIRWYLNAQRDHDPKLEVRGAVIAVAVIDNVHPDFECWQENGDARYCSPWAVGGGQWHWHLTKVRPLAEPVPCKGALGLWTLPEDVESAVLAQLEAQ